jgi:invasion protein IalB
MTVRRRYRATAIPALTAVLCLAAFLTQAPAALAQAQRPAAAPPAPKPLGAFESWTSAELGSGKGKVCYMFARPTDSAPKAAKRGEIMVVITHRPGDKRQDEVSFQSGYPFKAGAPVAVEVDGKKFEFFTRPEVEPEAAWARDPAADKAIVTALRAGNMLKVRGTSQRDTATTDTFSLAGFSRAYAEIGKACNVK